MSRNDSSKCARKQYPAVQDSSFYSTVPGTLGESTVDTGKKTPGGAGTHTGHTGHTGARGHTDHTDEPHNHPPKPKRTQTRTKPVSFTLFRRPYLTGRATIGRLELPPGEGRFVEHPLREAPSARELYRYRTVPGTVWYRYSTV